ncbi:PREDICTED: 7-methylguanosine phosphate-specific 5'-nucleotidase A [Populus euphratica]|uniref:5'-nucleotidase n=1 Tax=Populus euphratica TaxID=75702 RepID=A0AAJ6U7M3_POPEU|nr:PREDICTED: 7-methylguanosine phosphate-specific 5'-nucleotidase A [Populus euphratica]
MILYNSSPVFMLSQMSCYRLQNILTALPACVNITYNPQPCYLIFTSPPSNNSRVLCSGYSSKNQVKKMEAGHHDLSKVTVFGDPQLLQRKIDAVRLAGPAKLQVIADFDGTLTNYFVNGRRGQSSHGILKQGNAEYDDKRQALYEYYHPLEFSPTIPIEEKTKLMEEWWGKTHNLLIEGGLTYDAIKESVASSAIAFRDGVVELFEFLEERDIPVLIFSAGLADIIEEVLRQKVHRSFKNVKIVSNRMVFDNDGRLISFKGKLIHSLNKNEHALEMAAPVHEHFGDGDGPINDNASVKKRTNVLLLGDHLGDLGMSDGLDYETRISAGFLNDNIENNLSNYCKAFDVVYLNDAPMWGVVKLVSQMCSTVN